MVLEAAVAAGVKGVEWTDDGFLEPGDVVLARETMYATLKAGLCTVSYAALFRAGLHDRSAFTRALSTAHELNSPNLRIWSGLRSQSAEADAEAFVSTARYLGDEAGALGVTLCFGVSADSILDSCERAADLLAGMDHPFIKLALAPDADSGFDASMEAIQSVSGSVGLVMVKSSDLIGRDGTGDDRSEVWLQYLDSFDEQGGNPDMARHVVIKSIPGNDPADLEASIRAICNWSVTLRRYHQRRVY